MQLICFFFQTILLSYVLCTFKLKNILSYYYYFIYIYIIYIYNIYIIILNIVIILFIQKIIHLTHTK